MKNKIITYSKSVLVLLAVIFIAGIVRAQTNPLANITPGEYTSEWQLYQSYELVDIYYRYADCSDPANGLYPENLLFKVLNKTAGKVYVYWDYVLEYNNITASAAPDENLVQVRLEASQSAEGSCTNLHQTKLGIFYRYKEGNDVLTGFQLNDLKEFKLD